MGLYKNISVKLRFCASHCRTIDKSKWMTKIAIKAEQAVKPVNHTDTSKDYQVTNLTKIIHGEVNRATSSKKINENSKD